MPLEGLSSSNIGLNRLITPIENAMQTEMLAKENAETVIKKIDKSELTENNLDEEQDKESNYEGRSSDSGSEKDDEDDSENILLENKAVNIKKYKVRFNSINDVVELINRRTGEVIETIHPDGLMDIIAKAKNASGVLIDREV